MEEIPNAKNLLKLQVDFGSEKRQAVSGIKNYYTPDDLLGRDFIFVLNLERKSFLGVESQCMILAANDEKGRVVLLQPEKEIEVGCRIR